MGLLLLARVVVRIDVLDHPRPLPVDLDDRLALGDRVVPLLLAHARVRAGGQVANLRLVQGVAEADAERPADHGDVFVDPYEWLRDKDDPEVISYLEAENAYTEAQTAHLSELSDAIFGEIKARTKETDLSVPTRNHGWWYYGRSFEGREYGTFLPAAEKRAC